MIRPYDGPMGIFEDYMGDESQENKMIVELYNVIELPSGKFMSIQRQWMEKKETYRVVESPRFTRCLVFGGNDREHIVSQLHEVCSQRNIKMPTEFKIRQVRAELTLDYIV